MWLFLWAVLVSAFFQAVFLPVHLGLLLVALVSLKREEEIWVWLFLAGLGFDLVVGLPVGFSSLLFLLTGLLVRLAVSAGYGGMVAGGVIFLGTLVTGFFASRTWPWRSALATVVLSLVVWVVARWWGVWQGTRKLQV